MTTRETSPGADSARRVGRVSRVSRAATVTIVAGGSGAVCAAAILLAPPMVSTDRFSYPFDTAWFVVAQLVFVVQHAAMVAGVLGLAALAPPSARLSRAGLVMAGIGLVLLAACELFALVATTATNESSLGGAVAAAYGLPTVLVGLGFLLAGWVVARLRLLPWGRWVPVLFGGWVFVVLVPALGSGSHVAGRLAIAGWMVLYLLLGVALRRRGDR